MQMVMVYRAGTIIHTSVYRNIHHARQDAATWIAAGFNARIVVVG